MGKKTYFTRKSEGFNLSFIERGSIFEDEQRQSRTRDDGEQCKKQKSIATEKTTEAFQLKEKKTNNNNDDHTKRKDKKALP